MTIVTDVLVDGFDWAQVVHQLFGLQVELVNVGVEEDRNYTCIPYNKVDSSSASIIIIIIIIIIIHMNLRHVCPIQNG